MKAMAIGDLAFFYHSVNEKQIVGIVEICALYHPDPTDASGRFGMVRVKAVKSLKIPVTLEDIKADERLCDMALVRQPRLSVTPVAAKQWAIIMDKAQTRINAEEAKRQRLAAGELGLDIYNMRGRLADAGLTYVETLDELGDFNGIDCRGR